MVPYPVGFDDSDNVNWSTNGIPSRLIVTKGGVPHLRPNPKDADSDDDGVFDGEDGLADSDGDGLPNALDPDSDNDGLHDGTERGLNTTMGLYANQTRTTPYGAGDTLPDGRVLPSGYAFAPIQATDMAANWFSPTNTGDAFYDWGTHATLINPANFRADEEAPLTEEEIATKTTNPKARDTDGDFVPDASFGGFLGEDKNSDGLTETGQGETDPAHADEFPPGTFVDTDSDGLPDVFEMELGTDPEPVNDLRHPRWQVS